MTVLSKLLTTTASIFALTIAPAAGVITAFTADAAFAQEGGGEGESGGNEGEGESGGNEGEGESGGNEGEGETGDNEGRSGDGDDGESEGLLLITR